MSERRNNRLTGCDQLKIYSANRIVCVYDTQNPLPLQLAYKFARAMTKTTKINSKEKSESGIDPVKIGEYATRIETSLEQLRKTNTCLSTIKRESETAKSLIKEHEQNVFEIVSEMEEVLRRKQHIVEGAPQKAV